MAPEQAAVHTPRSTRRLTSTAWAHSLSHVNWPSAIPGNIHARNARSGPRATARAPATTESEDPRDLETIALKCLEKVPSQRYATADAMADDLRRWLDGRPIQARPVSPVEHGWRWCRRQPVIAALTGILFLTLIGSFGVLMVLLRRSETLRRAPRRIIRWLRGRSTSFFKYLIPNQ